MGQIKQRLAFIYKDKAEGVYPQLEALIAEFKDKIPQKDRKNRPFFSEEDVVLITYADHIQQKGEKTLITMRNFLQEFIKGYINKVHFLPFCPYSSDDGFSVIDYMKIKEEFGDWPDVSAIGKDFGLMFDLVINHISQKSEWFQKFLAGDPQYKDYFIAYDEEVDTSAVFRPRTHPLLTPFETKNGKKYVWTTFSTDQIDLNFSNPDVMLAMLRVLLYYIQQGAEVIRLDAITYFWKQLGTNCVHLPETHESVKLMRDVLEQVAPYVWIITETNVPHKDNISYFGNGNDEAHLVYNFALPPLLLLSFINQDATALTNWAQTLEYPSENATFFNFTASHDGIGVTPIRDIVPPEEVTKLVDHVLASGGKVNYRAVAGQDPVPYELNIVYLSALKGNIDAFIASQAIELSLRGVPAIYLNSFIGEENWTEGVETLGYNRAINRHKFDYPTLQKELTDSKTKKSQVYNKYKKLLTIRKGEPLFSPAVRQVVLSLDPSVFALRRVKGEDALLVLINVTDSEVMIPTEKLKGAIASKTGKDLVNEETVDLTKSALTLSPYQIRWIK